MEDNKPKGKVGRPKGVENRVNHEVKTNFQKAFDKLGGVDGLVEWANKSVVHQRFFYQWYSRMLPREQIIESDIPHGITFNLKSTDDKE